MTVHRASCHVHGYFYSQSWLSQGTASHTSPRFASVSWLLPCSPEQLTPCPTHALQKPSPRPQAPSPFWGTQAPQDAQDPSEDPGPSAFPSRPATKQRLIPFLRLDHVVPCSPPGRDRLWAQKVVLPIALLRWTEGGQSEMTPTALPSQPLRASVSLVPGHDLRTYCSEVSVELVVLPQISQEAGGRPGGLLTVRARGARVRGGHNTWAEARDQGHRGRLHLSRFFLMKISLRSPSK